MTETEAARLIIWFMRQVVARRAFSYMLTHGPVWQSKEKFRDDNLSALFAVRQLSKKNISALRKKLTPLDQSEIDFADNFLKCSFHATHATKFDARNEKGILKLLSRRRLIEEGIVFPKGNSPPEDIQLIANDDFVFLSLEVGGAKGKPESRFGEFIFHFDLRSPSFENSFMSLVEMRFAQTPNSDRHIDFVEGFPHKQFTKRKLEPLAIVFHGIDTIAGILFSLLLDLRAVTDKTTRGKLLSLRTPDHINRLINGIFRPEIKVPKYLITKNFKLMKLSPPKIKSKL